MIIILSQHNDIHALSVKSCIENQINKEAIILDVADFPTKWSIDCRAGRLDQYIIKCHDRNISSKDIEGVWRRRGLSPGVHESITDREVRNFSYGECAHLFNGVISNTSNVINQEGPELSASRKPHQLKVASSAGLLIPDTLISTDPSEILSFYNHHEGNIVFKTLGSPQFSFAETRLMMDEHISLIGSAVFAPTIYQKAIFPDFHLRITIIDDNVWCASIESNDIRAIMDWRIDHNTIIKEYRIHDNLSEKLIRMMKMLGIRYGAVDMIVDRSGDCYFLEVNPGGQFLFVEIETGLPISLSLGMSLCMNRS